MPHSTAGAHGYFTLRLTTPDNASGTKMKGIAASARAFGRNHHLDVRTVSLMSSLNDIFMYWESPDPAPQATQQMLLMHSHLDTLPDVAQADTRHHCCWIDA